MIGSIILFVVIIFLLLIFYKPESSRQQFLLASEKMADVTWKKEAELNDEIFYIDFDISDTQQDITTDEYVITDIGLEGVEGFANNGSSYDIRQHPDFHQYVLKSSIPSYQSVQKIRRPSKKQKQKRPQPQVQERPQMQQSPEQQQPIHPPYNKNIHSLFQLNDENDEETYNRIMRANLKDPRLRAAVENRFYAAKQIEHNLLNNISKL